MTKASHEKLRRDIEAVRIAVEALQVERDELDAALIPKAEAIARLDDWMSRRRLDHKTGAADAFCRRELSTVPRLIRPAATGGHSVEFGNVETALIAFAGDLVREQLASEIEELYGKNAGVTDADRNSRLDEIDDELLGLETREEKLICQAEEVGVFVQRRADADPRALVAACEARS